MWECRQYLFHLCMLLLLTSCQNISNEERCQNRQQSIAALTLASESLAKASNYYQNFSYCDIDSISADVLNEKDRITFYLEAARDRISEVQGDIQTVLCGGNIVQDSGFITSPNYPDDYPPNQNCTWTIYVPTNHQIVLKFPLFEIQYKESCAEDYLEVLDGHNSTSAVLGRFCGYNISEHVRSTNNTLTVKFISNSHIQKAGFIANFIKDADECRGNHGCQHQCINTPGSYKCECRSGFTLKSDGKTCNESCTYKITNPDGYITSPNFPQEYPNNLRCDWRFTTLPGHVIKLLFENFVLESQTTCNFDNIIAFNGKDNNSYIMAEYCGNNRPPPIVSSQNSLYLTFKADGSNTYQGFKIQHTTVCGGEMLAQRDVSKIYSHPNFGNGTYSAGVNCRWIIRGVNENRVRLHFLTFNLEHHDSCDYDSVTIYDGHDDSKKFIGKFCFNNVPPDITSTKSTFLIVFTTDGSAQKDGFSAEFIIMP